MVRLFSAVVSVVALLGILIQVTGYAHASSEKRVALVIGNSDYKDPSLTLASPKNDADAIAAVLKSLDFEVMLVTNVGKQQMDSALELFARRSTTADSALFFYAGHAIQQGGKNYLMPIDAQSEDKISIQNDLTSVDSVRTALDRASGVRILILDACRNNPAAGVNRLAGLARIDRADGLVIAYATAPDTVAQDGTNSAHSPFSSALIKEMGEPGLEIEKLFRRVAEDVSDATNGKQRPETSVSVLNDYYLNQSDRKVWEETRESADIPRIQEFLDRFPNSPFSFQAKNRLEMLERAQWDKETRIRREREMEEELERIDQLREQEDDERQTKLKEDRKNVMKEAKQRQEAVEKLFVLERERVKAEQKAAARKEEEAGREEARRRAEEACKADLSSVNAAGRDEAKLKGIIGGASTCADAKLSAQSVVAALVAEREQAIRACDSESKQLAVLVKGPGTAEKRNRLLGLQSSLTCTSLAPRIVEALGRVDIEIMIRSSQVELKRLGCYRGAENGVLNDATRDALKKVFAGSGMAPEIDEAVLSKLKTLAGPICTPPKTEPVRRTIPQPPVPERTPDKTRTPMGDFAPPFREPGVRF